ncbi:MAG: MBOAT family protein [Dysgonamonadaceae bacterium]|jgi:D-alanyl-lipoteichoic acid acyltransferase DltB (MBOAT superfamily)|nr:MBOAT family protein [Dysgonamonadaceae bacterium]
MTDISNIFNGVCELFGRKVQDALLFNSGTFWVMFTVFILGYAFIFRRKIQMMLYVAAFSLFFYYQTNGLIFVLLPFTAFCDFLIAQRIHKSSNERHRKAWLALSICMSIGILVYFKYSNFFIKTLNEITAGNFSPLDIFLPVGISFYTFQTISYVVDVYKGRVSPVRSFLEYVFYLSFFPLILAGPIMRAGRFFPQIGENKTIDKSMIYGGLWLIICGLLKKALFADYIAQYNNLVFDSPTGYSGFEGLMAIWGYAAQIYCDFSGYSDISIGMAAVMGFDLGKNFNMPYQAKNLSEFWRRWHISLSSWMRDYIYIPLGGNRKGAFRTKLNNLATMLVGGLWHGAAWQFVLWGGMHGVGLIVHKWCKPWLDKIPDCRPVKILSTLSTFLFVAFLWIFFRSPNMETALQLIVNVATDFDPAFCLPFFQARKTWCILLALVFLLHAAREAWMENVKNAFVRSHWMVKALIFLAVIQSIVQFGSNEVQPFIYFQF